MSLCMYKGQKVEFYLELKTTNLQTTLEMVIVHKEILCLLNNHALRLAHGQGSSLYVTPGSPYYQN